MSKVVQEAVKRLRARADEPKARMFGLESDLRAIALALDVLDARIEAIAAAEISRHFSGEPLPGEIFEPIYSFGREAHELAVELNPLYQLVRGKHGNEK